MTAYTWSSESHQARPQVLILILQLEGVLQLQLPIQCPQCQQFSTTRKITWGLVPVLASQSHVDGEGCGFRPSRRTLLSQLSGPRGFIAMIYSPGLKALRVP